MICRLLHPRRGRDAAQCSAVCGGALILRCAAVQEVYTKFLAIGLFRLLELGGAKDPKALEGLVTALNVRTSAVNRDLLTYKARPLPQLLSPASVPSPFSKPRLISGCSHLPVSRCLPVQ